MARFLKLLLLCRRCCVLCLRGETRARALGISMGWICRRWDGPVISTELIGMNETKAYTAGQKGAQMLRDICGWLNINSMRAEKVSHPYRMHENELV